MKYEIHQLSRTYSEATALASHQGSGQSTLTFDLIPTMAPSTKSATISLKRPNMSYQGKVKVPMTAQQA